MPLDTRHPFIEKNDFATNPRVYAKCSGRECVDRYTTKTRKKLDEAGERDASLLNQSVALFFNLESLSRAYLATISNLVCIIFNNRNI
jgi:hypothetical protein